jgi:transposase
VVSADDKTIIELSLSAGSSHDAPEGRKLLNLIGKTDTKLPMIMDKAYEGDETRNLVVQLGYEPIVPPKSNRLEKWEYNKELYKRRNIVERFFRRMKEFRRVFTRYDKLDIMFLAFVMIALIQIYSISVNRP